jgi:hypothetical protein
LVNVAYSRVVVYPYTKPQRYHDKGCSWWVQIIPFYFFWMLFAAGDKEKNSYGESPK